MSAFNRRIAGQITGWKALLLAIGIVSAIGISAWARFQPRSFAKGTWTIDSGKAMFYQFKSSRHTTLKAVFTPSAGSSDPYTILIVDDTTCAQLKAHTVDPQNVTNFGRVQGSGTLTLPPVPIPPGTYYLIANNDSKNTITMQYNLYEIKDSSAQ